MKPPNSPTLYGEPVQPIEYGIDLSDTANRGRKLYRKGELLYRVALEPLPEGDLGDGKPRPGIAQYWMTESEVQSYVTHGYDALQELQLRSLNRLRA